MKTRKNHIFSINIIFCFALLLCTSYFAPQKGRVVPSPLPKSFDVIQSINPPIEQEAAPFFEMPQRPNIDVALTTEELISLYFGGRAKESITIEKHNAATGFISPKNLYRTELISYSPDRDAYTLYREIQGIYYADTSDDRQTIIRLVENLSQAERAMVAHQYYLNTGNRLLTDLKYELSGWPCKERGDYFLCTLDWKQVIMSKLKEAISSYSCPASCYSTECIRRCFSSTEVCAPNEIWYTLSQQYDVSVQWKYNKSAIIPQLSLQSKNAPKWTRTTNELSKCNPAGTDQNYPLLTHAELKANINDYVEKNLKKPQWSLNKIYAKLDISGIKRSWEASIRNTLERFTYISTNDSLSIQCEHGIQNKISSGIWAFSLPKRVFCRFQAEETIWTEDIYPQQKYHCILQQKKCFSQSSTKQHPNSIHVSIDGIKHPFGTLHVQLYASMENTPFKIIKEKQLNVENTSPISISFADVSYDYYIVSVHHDVLDDNQDYQLFDLTDRYGISGWISHTNPFMPKPIHLSHNEISAQNWNVHIQLQKSYQD